MKLLILFLLFLNLVADEKNYSVRLAYGKATISDFSEIIIGNIKKHPNDLYVTALEGGYRVAEDYKDFPIDVYIKSGLSYFNENGYSDNVIEGVVYIKAYYKFDFLANRIRIGAGEGVSYTDHLLYTEILEATQEHDHNSKFLNYLDISVDFDFGRLTAYKPLYDTYIGFTLKHRSGIFGLINNVKRGGSNYPTVSIEKNF